MILKTMIKDFPAGLSEAKNKLSVLTGSLKNVGKFTLSLAKAHPIITGITAALTVGATAATIYKNKQKEAAQEIEQAYQKAKEAIDESSNSIKNTEDTIESMGREYAELAQGVNQATGENISLNTSDYERFLSLNRQLAELFPTLSQKYTENGDVIVQLSGDIDTIVDSLQNLINVQKDLENYDIVENLPNLYKGIKQKSDAYNKKIKKSNDNIAADQGKLDILNNDDIYSYIDELIDNGEFTLDNPNNLDQNYNDNLRQIFNDLLKKTPIKGYNVEFIKDHSKNSLDTTRGISINFSDATEEDIENARAAMKHGVEELKREYNTDIMNKTDEINNNRAWNQENWASFIPAAIAYVSMDPAYKSLGKLQKSVQDIIKNFDWMSANFSEEEALNFILNNILGLFQGENSTEIKTSLSNATKAKSKFLSGNATLNDYKKSISTLMSYLKDADPKVQNAFNEMFTISTDDGFTTYTLLNNIKNKFKNITGELDKQIGNLTLNDLQFAVNLDVPDGTFTSWKDFFNKLEEEKAKLSVPPDLPYKDALDQIQSLSTGLDQLSSIYADIYDKGDFKWSSILNNGTFNDTFSQFGETYDNFIKIISNAPDNIEACQEAFNKLSGAYVSSKISNVTEETKEATIAFLKQNNIANANALVMQALKEKQNAYDFVTKNLNMSLEDFNKETYESQDALLKQAGASETCRYYLMKLQLQKIAVFDDDLNANDKIKQLKELAVAYEITGTAAEEMANRQKEAADYKKRTGASTGVNYTYNEKDYKRVEEELRAKMEEKFNNFLDGEFNPKPPSVTNPYDDGSANDSANSLFDFIEIRLTRLKAKTQNIINQITEYTSTALKRTLLNNSINSIFEEIDAQVQAYSQYMAKAEAVVLDEYWKEKIRNGSIEINASIPEKTSQALSDYQNWYEKALAAQEEINALKTEELNKVKELAELEASIYERRISASNYKKEALQQYISYKEATGGELLASVYDDLIENNYEIRDSIGLKIDIYKNLVKQLDATSEAYLDYMNKIQEAELSLWDIDRENAEFYKTKNELPIKEIQSWLDYLDSIGKEYKSLADYRKQIGTSLSTEHYQDQIKSNLNQIKGLEKQKEAVRSLVIYSSNARNLLDELEYSKQYHEIESAIYDLKSANDTLKDSMRDDVYWRDFEKAHTVTQKLADNLQSLSSLINDDALMDDDGKLTKNGNAKVALYLKQYETAKEEVVNYMKDLNNAFKLNYQGFYTTDEYNEKLAELQKGLLEAADSVKTFTDSLIDLYVKQGQAEIDALDKLIKSRTEALKKKKEYYDYDKTIRGKSKDIQALETQKAALEATEDTLEKRKKLLELEDQLQEMRDDLEDTKYDHEINLIVNGLDDFTQDVQERFDTYTKNLQNSLEMQTDIINHANEMYADSYGKVQTVLNGILSSYGIDTSQTMFNTATLLGDSTKAQLMESFFKINSPNYKIDNPKNTGNVINCDVTFDFKTNPATVQDFKQMIPEITDKVSAQLAQNLKKIGY